MATKRQVLAAMRETPAPVLASFWFVSATAAPPSLPWSTSSTLPTPPAP
ncbi:MAG: hypothetical protein KGL53_10710 [Elusimicrobia bacterium]|nr:hypothetical protein [Elusimicrobiota bacterium]